MHEHQISIKVHGDKHWKTNASTCLTFLTYKDNLKETRKTFETYVQGNHDVCLWLALTKYKVINPFDIFSSYRTDKSIYEIIKASYLYNWRQIFFGKKWKLWSPIPSIATHMESSFLAPNIDWLSVMEEEIRDEQLIG